MRAIGGNQLAKPHMHMFLEITAHKFVPVANAAALDAVGSEQQPRSFNPAATDHENARSRLPFSAGGV